jgi:hypothetical protein
MSSCLTFTQDVKKEQITRINDYIFLVEYTKNYFLLGSLYTSASLLFYKEDLKIDEEFKKTYEHYFYKHSNQKKYDYLCFFRRFKWQPLSFAHNYVTFTGISYDDYEKIFFLIKELFIKDLFTPVWKLYFSLCVTDRTKLVVSSMATSSFDPPGGGDKFKNFMRTCPTYTYIFDD